MKKFLLKAIPILIIGIVIFAIFHIIYTIKMYDTILTARPLWMSVLIEAILWLVPILIGVIVYIIISKHSKE